MINWTRRIRQFPGLFALFTLVVLAACLRLPTRPPVTPVPPPVVVPPVEPPPATPEPTRRPTREEVLSYRGWLTGLKDSAGRHIWSPALPGAPAEVRREWLDILAAAGATHVPIGPFEAGPSYPGVHWPNPDWTRDPAAIRGLIDDLLATPTARGHGLIPVVFTDGGGPNPRPRQAIVLPTLEQALAGVADIVMAVPCGWESYEWTARECHDIAWQYDAMLRRLTPAPVIAWHGWVGRSNGASNPPQADDPWLNPGTGFGDWSLFWSPRLSPFEVFLYQSDPQRDMAHVQCGGPGSPTFDSAALRTNAGKFDESCWMNRTSDAIARVGAGICTNDFGEGSRCGPDPSRRVFVFFESHAYFEFRDQMEPGVGAAMASYAQSECRKFGVTCGLGNSLGSRADAGTIVSRHTPLLGPLTPTGPADLHTPASVYLDTGVGFVEGMSVHALGLGNKQAAHSVLPHRINRVVFHCPDEEVAGVYARRVVAGVARDHACWDRSSAQFQGQVGDSREFPLDPHHSVAAAGERPFPHPAIATAVSTVSNPILNAQPGHGSLALSATLNGAEESLGVAGGDERSLTDAASGHAHGFYVGNALPTEP